ncbi:hypothetical protein Terro_1532 [Terriglobus roseus DSM 18391]|uniref:Uncharacterized protein n=1 Tax=Terriglobus roseus (strain DSM 18391 / NRRL B-41598 / KBS 63) TaxID=926566 RepID=I3ZF21_TERRK|nr:hypothetical protein [Terriglobus roseus]AFL87839.1 hypothetical protein Terro_1532 [Terriglobus roseus DSM 18391]
MSGHSTVGLKILRLAALLALLAIALAPVFWLSWAHRSQRDSALTAAFDGRKGQYTSPSFVPTKGATYQVEIYFLPSHQPLKLDWKVLDDGGAILAKSRYSEMSGDGNLADLGEYEATSQSAQRIVVDLQSEADFDSTLHVEPLEAGPEGRGYAIPLAGAWAAIVLFGAVVGLRSWFCEVLS